MIMKVWKIQPAISIAAGAISVVAAEKPNVIVFFTDDHGYADIGIQGMVDDVRTPHIDRLAEEGVRFTSGYVTCPISGPSRAGLMTGRYQQRMGVETNSDLPFELNTVPFPERMRQVGYRTGMTGKLHLPMKGEKSENPDKWGFDEFAMKAGDFSTAPKRRLTTHSPEGKLFDKPVWMDFEEYRLDVSTRFALQFIDRNHESPFFLYVAYFGPHVPLEAPEKYLSRFPGDMPEARRYALAMISAIDDGVGAVVEKLKSYGIDDNTMIFFIGDNGAPYEFDENNMDLPIDQLKRWDGSLNTPLLGEKGILGEGGIRVPYLMRWKNGVSGGQVIDIPVSSLDVAATVLAQVKGDVRNLDGENLVPVLTGGQLLREALFWRAGGQTAVRKGDWKYLKTQDHGPYLFDMKTMTPERENLINRFPEMAAEFETMLADWEKEMTRGLIRTSQINQEKTLFNKHYGNISE